MPTNTAATNSVATKSMPTNSVPTSSPLHVVRDEAKPSILLIGEDQRNCRLVSHILAEEGLNVYVASNAQAGMALLSRRDVSLVIFDTTVPTESDLQLPHEIRRLRCYLPLILLVGDGAKAEPLLAHLLIDDYLVKPYSYTELVARVRTQLYRTRRDAAQQSVVVKAGGLELDISALTVAAPGHKKVFLSPTEMKVLRCLMVRQGELVKRAVLAEAIWGSECVDDSYVRVCIGKVRRKLERCGGVACIEAVRGAGYRLAVKY